mgnify:CR=1 FL=1
MNAYQGLAGAYDSLTGDVEYEKRADYLEKLFTRSRIPVHTVLDLACGTGTMTWLLTGRGYEMIGADASEEMLAAAMMKSGSVAAICCLDSLNYLTSPADVQRTFQRLHLFIAPGGELIFDVNTLDKFQSLDGQVFLDETEESYCVWRTEFRRSICTYWVVPQGNGRTLPPGYGAAPAAVLCPGGADRLASGGRVREHPRVR